MLLVWPPASPRPRPPRLADYRGREAPFAPWGVQLAGDFSKAWRSPALTGAQSYAVLGDVRPMVIGTRLRSRGTRAFYRVRAPAASRAAATGICAHGCAGRAARAWC